MDATNSTCWTMLQAAAEGDDGARGHFATRYAPLVRAYLSARWRGSSMIQELDDAVQDVFVECLKHDGGLDRAEPGRPGGFRAFFYGLVRNVACRVEQRRASRTHGHLDSLIEPDEVRGDEEALSRMFDRAWAKSVMRQAAERMAERAEVRGEAAKRRVALLRARFEDDLPIREIARSWQVDPASLHHEYARARIEFREALQEVVAFHHPGSSAEVEHECRELLGLLR